MNKNTNRFSEEHRQADSIVRIENKQAVIPRKALKERENQHYQIPENTAEKKINNTQINGTEYSEKNSHGNSINYNINQCGKDGLFNKG